MPVEIRNVKYTTLDRSATFTFDFVQTTVGTWRAYITDQPSYNDRPHGAVQAHRLVDGRGAYVCWMPEPRSLDEAKGAARAWADATHEYVQTGVFPPPGTNRHVPDVSTSATWELRGHQGLIPDPPPARRAPAAPAAPEPIRVTHSRPAGLRALLSNRRNRS